MKLKRIHALGGSYLAALFAWLIFDSWHFGGPFWGNFKFGLFLGSLFFPVGVIQTAFGWSAAERTVWGPVLGWGMHLLLAYGCLRVRSSEGYYALYGVFCVILILDIIGMHEGMVEFSGW